MDQASDHSAQNKIQRNDIDLEVSERPPTGDQLKSILEKTGCRRQSELVATLTHLLPPGL